MRWDTPQKCRSKNVALVQKSSKTSVEQSFLRGVPAEVSKAVILPLENVIVAWECFLAL
jgi:hypothetical protein